MFLDIFRRKKSKDFISIDNHVPINEVALEKSIEELSFESKVIHVLNGKEVPFPEKCKQNGTIFEKEKYLSAAKEIYISSFANDIIEKIEITQLNGDAGHCIHKIKNNKLCITIRIDPFKMGIVTRSGYIHEFSDERCNEFTNILAHELMHAEDFKSTIDKFGIEEYHKIGNSEIAKLGRNVLTEYSACRRTAEQYGAFDPYEDIERIFDGCYLYLGTDNISERLFENPGNSELDYAMRLNYAIATRCAFADVLQEKEDDLWVNNESYQKYIILIRDLLGENYDCQPLDEERFKKFGHQILSGLSEIYNVRNNIVS